MSFKQYLSRCDPFLVAALTLAFAFSLYGIRWGRVEDWNRDQMALREVRGILPLDYQKPPLHTYLNHIMVLAPIDALERISSSLAQREIHLNELRLLGSRLLVVLLFLATICLAYLLSRDAYGIPTARVIAFAFASSAGFIEYTHFLSCDSPLLFFLTATLLLAYQITWSGKLSFYLLAGLFTGLTAAMKYNGLAVGLCLVVAHLWPSRPRSFASILLSPWFFAGLAMVPVGFFLGNPGVLLDYPKFIADFTYNSKVTPHYNGVMTGHGYLAFLTKVPEVMGWPGSILLTLAVIFSLIILLSKKDWRSPSALCFTMAVSVFALYYVAIGSFPRIETRFVLPALPFLILMTGPFLQALLSQRQWPYFIFFGILLYNSVCCAFVGRRFSQDPRLRAQVWIQRHARPGLILESSAEAPHWGLLPGVNAHEVTPTNPPPVLDDRNKVVDWRMPYTYGRLPLFRRLFPNDLWLQAHLGHYEIEGDDSLFTLAQLSERNPHLVVVYSTPYPSPSAVVTRYYSDLLTGVFPYDIVFAAGTKAPPWWTYPKKIDFLDGAVTILKRRPPSR